jgi:hypothetical protein
MTHLEDHYLVALGEYEKQKTTGREKASTSQDKNKKFEDYIIDIQEQIIDILATYGGSVHSVPDQEQLLVTVEFGNMIDELPTKIHIKAKMSDIHKVAKDKISKQEFKKLVEVQKF